MRMSRGPIPVYPLTFQRGHCTRSLDEVLDLARRRAKARLRRQRITIRPNTFRDWLIEDTDQIARRPHLRLEDEPHIVRGAE